MAWIIFLMAAITTCFQDFSRSFRAVANFENASLHLMAVVAGKYRAFLRIEFPIFEMEGFECTEVPEFLS